MTVKAPGQAILVAAVAAALLAGCGSPEATPSASSSSTSNSPVGSSEIAAPATTTTPSVADDATVVDIAISSGTVTPTNGQAQGSVGRPIVLRVSSDVTDSLHVHSVPEHTFSVQPHPNQEFEFTVDVPGQVDIELHDLSRTVVTIQVRP